jgi:hypothetical protein
MRPSVFQVFATLAWPCCDETNGKSILVAGRESLDQWKSPSLKKPVEFCEMIFVA